MDVHKYAKCSIYDGSHWDQGGFCYHDVCTVLASLKCAWQLIREHTDISVYCLLSTQTHRLNYGHIIWTESCIHKQFTLKYSHANSVSMTKPLSQYYM